MKTLITMTAFAITSLTANAYFLQNVHNIEIARNECSERDNVNIKNCQLKVVNVTPKELSDTTKLTLLMPPELR